MKAYRGTPAQQVTRWAGKARKATELRDFWIREMRSEGASLRVIAAAAGLTAPGVARILARHEKDPE